MLKKLISTCGLGALALLSVLPSKATNSTVCSKASYYGHGDIYHGRTTANGERFNGYGVSAAHRHYRFGTLLRVTNPSTRRSVVVRINDRGPYVAGRALDLSYGAFSAIASPSAGVIPICYTRLS